MAKPKVVYTSHTAEVMNASIDAARRGLWKAGQLALDYARDDVPLETGTLRRSGVVSVKLPNMMEVYNAAKSGAVGLPAYTGGMRTSAGMKGKVSATTGGLVSMYVSYNTPYAAWLHESPKWKPRAWKYLDTGKRPRAKVSKPAVGRPKYLYLAIQRVEPRIPALIALEMRARGF
jgi:hypothetical protein